MIKTPIAFFTFTRSKNIPFMFDIFKKIEPSVLYLFSDGGRNEQEQKQVEEVRKLLDTYNLENTKIIKFYSKTNNGPYIQIAEGAKKILEKEDRCIFVEDDNLPEISFFHFCEKMLDDFKDDPSVTMVYGTNYLLKYPKANSKNKYFKTRHSLPCGWATWSNKFSKFYDTEHFLDLLNKDNIALAGTHYYDNKMFLHDKTLWEVEETYQREHHLNHAWDVQLNYYLRLHNVYAISPCYNQIRNNGLDENATNTVMKRFGILRKICPTKSYDNYSDHYEYIGDKMSKKYDLKINKIRTPSHYLSYKLMSLKKKIFH